MTEPFISILTEGGKKNSLGRVNDVIELTLGEPARVNELYIAMFDEDPWVRMRAADAFEKVCRIKPDLAKPYINNIQSELDRSQQASIQWHIAEIYRQVELDTAQQNHAIRWLCKLLETVDVDWIVAADCMKTLDHFVARGEFDSAQFKKLLIIQTGHKSKAVAKKAHKYLDAI